MCGIAGILDMGKGLRIARGDLQLMVRSLRHRGPDGEGFHLNDRIGLGHARLSIIDLITGDQPIRNESGSVWVVFNGEIFNYIELKRELTARGHTFYTESDTEVIVHLYEDFGLDFAARLNGQFAIAIWDTEKDRLVLTRDRPGILPLYYSVDRGRLLFGSEIKALLPVMQHRPAMNPDALDQLLTFWAPVSPNTMFDNVFELPPGHQLIVEQGKLHSRCYWEWSFPESGNYLRGDVPELVEQAREILHDAVRLRLRADVPVGAYLSGGLDSSALTALIHKQSSELLRTFSIEFANEELNEQVHQRRMVDHIGAVHSSVSCSDAQIATALPGVIWHTEAPILRTAPVPMSLLSALVRDLGYKVVLTGEGADEVFGGYDLFKETKLRLFWSRQPNSGLRPILLKRLYPYLDLSKKQGEVYLRSFFGRGLEQPETPLFSHLTRIANTVQCKMFYSDDFKASLRDNAEATLTDALPPAFSRWAPFNRAQYLEARTLMPGYLLSSQGDRMLMKHSVEGRFPYLDHRLIEFANRLDPRLKMKVLNEKYLLKKSVSDLLPATIVNRYKQPYRAPDIPALFSGERPEYVGDLLCRSAIRNAGYFDCDKVERLIRKIEQGKAVSNRDNMAAVGVLSTQLWHDLFVAAKPLSSGNPIGRARPEESIATQEAGT